MQLDRHRHVAHPAIVTLLLSSALWGCGSQGSPSAGTGGMSGTGGGANTGGSGAGGVAGTGGATAGTGGVVGTGGAAAGTGGVVGTGGATAGTGGVVGTGGATAGTGGSAGRGGASGGAGPGTGGRGGSGATGGAAAGTGGGSPGGSSGSCPSVAELNDWPSGKGPADVGKAVVGAFLPRTQDVYGANGDAGDGYAWTFGYFGSLQFTKTSGDTTTNAKLLSDYTKAVSGSKPLPANPPPDGTNQVDRRAFGDLPLEVFLQTQDAAAKMLGMARADVQWSVTSSDGITRDARYWIDDMFMITGLQVYAYRATKDKKYLDRAVLAMKAYFTKLQQPDGLFNHTERSKAYWGRANGWVAVGMTELLLELPLGADRDAIMAGYKKQMDALVKFQITSGTDPGAWNQVLDVTTLKPEMSCTAMFTFALANGVKNGWLTDPKYAMAARNGWLALGKRTSSAGQLDQVCPGTGDASAGTIASQQQFYMNIQFMANDNHGQAALVWAANALLRKDCPGVR